MKFAIEWHENCVRNRARTLQVLKAQHIELMRRITSLERDIAWDNTRIEEAKRRGIEAYDPDRFMMRNGNRLEPR